MSGGVSELGGVALVKEKKELFQFMAGLCLAILLVLDVGSALLLSEIKSTNNNLELQQDLNILKENDFALAQNQGNIFNALVLNELGASGCRVTSRTSIDSNSFAVSLVCPVKEGS